MTDKPMSGLGLMRAPFAANQISKLPKPTKAQTDAVKADYKAGIRCEICGGWHHPKVVHLDYVGHAALTDRMLDADIMWEWEPFAVDDVGLPALDRNGGLWIRLTVDGVTRIGYGSADGKSGGDAMKEIIGDALRNAGMRFGAALDLWHKGDLHADPVSDAPTPADEQPSVYHAPEAGFITDDQRIELMGMMESMNVNVQEFVEAVGIKTLSMLSTRRFNDARAKITEMAAQ